jgi:hypothetical protein
MQFASAGVCARNLGTRPDAVIVNPVYAQDRMSMPGIQFIRRVDANCDHDIKQIGACKTNYPPRWPRQRSR